MHAEQWWSIGPTVLPRIAEMVTSQKQRFEVEAKRLERLLREREQHEPIFRPTSRSFAQLQRQIDERRDRS